jgi:hypothetical protein
VFRDGVARGGGRVGYGRHCGFGTYSTKREGVYYTSTTADAVLRNLKSKLVSLLSLDYSCSN